MNGGPMFYGEVRMEEKSMEWPQPLADVGPSTNRRVPLLRERGPHENKAGSGKSLVTESHEAAFALNP